MIVMGAVYVVLAAVLIPNLDLAIEYQRPILYSLGDIPQEELVANAIGGEIVAAIAGVVGLAFGFGILRRKKWAWGATVIYNLLFILLSAVAFMTNSVLPDSYLVILSIFILCVLFMPKTCRYLNPLARKV